MGLLPTDEQTQARVRALAERAMKPENWYRPGESAVPGDNPFFREFVGTYRVVFSWTVGPKRQVHRHMSMSSASGKLPRPEFAFTVAHWLGFTGAKPDSHGVVWKPAEEWIIGSHVEDECVLIIGELIK